jgi:hypothetical protein
MNVKRTSLAALFLALGAVSLAQAAIINELPGNLFHQNGAPAGSNVSLAVNNPQNMGGGGWIGDVSGGAPNYPVGLGQSPVLDGNLDTKWSAGSFSGGAMCNFSISQGVFSADGMTFNATPFQKIGTIRIWAADWINDDSSVWNAFPKQVKIAYTTNAAIYNAIGNGYAHNSDTLGVLPGDWANDVTITAVNGNPVSTMDYGEGHGWTDLNGLFNQGNILVNSHQTDAYVDLTVNIPAGATSVMVSLGQTPDSPGGLAVIDVQASVPEPASLGLLGFATTGLLIRRRRA